MKKAAVIILNWNGEKMLSRFLPAVLSATDPSLADIVVADNGSTDGSVELLSRCFPSVRVVRFAENHGFAEGYNKAIAQVDNPFVVLLNSDVAPARGWLGPLVAHLEDNPRRAACQPKILAEADHASFEYAGAAGGFLDRNGYPFCRGRLFDAIERDEGQYDDTCAVDWASGAALAVRRDLYLEAGGLDARFFAHQEEIDLCWRLRLMGYDVDAVGASAVFHLGGGSLQAGNPRKTYLNFRNSLLMLYKNLPRAVRRGRLFKRRLLDTLAWAKFVAAFDWANAKAVLRAHRDFRRMKGVYDDLPDPKVDLLSGRPNILTQYYLKKRKKFSQIRPLGSKIGENDKS